MKTQRTLTNGTILTVELENNQFQSKLSPDYRGLGFEGDFGTLEEGETIETIADSQELWLNDNIN